MSVHVRRPRVADGRVLGSWSVVGMYAGADDGRDLRLVVEIDIVWYHSDRYVFDNSKKAGRILSRPDDTHTQANNTRTAKHKINMVQHIQ